MWILIALLSPLLYATANILDGYFANRRLPNLIALVFYSSLLNLLVLPVIFLLSPLVIPSPALCGVIILIGVTNFFYIYPYYRALQETDTSVVVSLFSLTNIFIPVFAYFLLGERLSVFQYAGFAVIVLASSLLTFDPKKFKQNKAFGLMLLSSLMVTVQAIGFKFVFEHGVNWGTAMGGQTFFAFLCVIPMLCIAPLRRNIQNGWQSFRGAFGLFVFEEFITFAAGAAATYAIALVPLTLEKTVEAFQPLFVLVFALIFARVSPRLFKERITAGQLAKKFILFTVMGVGVWLMVG